MSTIIKSNERIQGAREIAFNFDDMAAEANKFLQGIKLEAGRLATQAETEAAAIRARAEVEGRRDGQLAISQMLDEKIKQQMETALPALRAAVESIQRERQAWLAHWERSAVGLAAAIAGRLIRRELSHSPEIPLTLIREALELSIGSPQVRLFLNPADLEALSRQIDLLVSELAGLAPPQVLSDPSVTLGGCRVESQFGTIDQRFEAQLERIVEELT